MRIKTTKKKKRIIGTVQEAKIRIKNIYWWNRVWAM